MDKHFEILISKGEKKYFKKGNILFFQGEKANKIYILLNGKVRIYKVNTKGFELTLHTLTPVNFIAEMPVFEGIVITQPMQFVSKIVKFVFLILMNLKNYA
ncbi:cyclic nucleotide-binding domain-containing protein [Campylobacter sp. RKI_CA19_01122]|uniref:Crp/Fnr family transcriptional regulator n=1 Tax=Campylobacter sp. RKI_CA19_01122 TaxID=2911627 RepID=UPI002987FE91|nr:cyclic nucleotide-binding domain-containing protein [Campylobacter sp. RKI_CA19_01122]